MGQKLAVFLAKRKAVLALAVVTLIATGITSWFRSTPRLNVILVTFDTTRADHLGAYGYEKGLTSGFDDFAKQGVVFEHAYAPAPITLPSHATMLTGLYPPEHGLRVNGKNRLSDQIPLLPEMLKQHGYDTAAFIAAFVLDSTFGLERGFDTYDDDLSKATAAMESDERRRDGADIVNSALAWLRQRNSRPFFCWIHLYDAHGPYDMRSKLFGQRFVQQPYDAGIAVEVQQFQRVIAFLKERKLDKKTLVIVAGDHGEGLDEHMEIEHGMLVYNTTLHVPFVFGGPPEIRPGRRVADCVSLVDLTPTVLDALRIPAPKHVSGRSLFPAMKGLPIGAKTIYAEAETPLELNRWYPLRAVVSDRWKYIHSKQPELYDLQNDPGETANLFDSNADQAQELRNVLETMQESFVRTDAQEVRLSEKDQANLGDLGYVTGGNRDANAQPLSIEDLPDVKEMLPYLAKYETARLVGLEGKLDQTIALLREIVDVKADYTSAFVLLADCLFRTNRLKEAVEPYRSALKLRPEYVRVRLSLAQCLAAQGKFEDAAIEFREAVKRDPQNAQACYQLAEALVATQQLDEAIVEFREAIRIAPDLVIAHVRLGEVLAKLQRPSEAAPYFEQAIKIDRNNTAARSGLLRVLLKTNELDKALLYAKDAVEVDPKSFEYRFNLGTVLALLGRRRDAILEFKEAQRLRPNDPAPSMRVQQIEAAIKRDGK